MGRRSVFTNVAAVIVLGIALLLSGCGGGTVGTSPVSKRLLQGEIIQPDGSVLAGAFVAETGNGNGVFTDAKGAFELGIESESGDIDLTVEAEGKSVSVLIPDSTEPSSVIAVKLQVDLNKGTVTQDVYKFSVLPDFQSPSSRQCFTKYFDRSILQHKKTPPEIECKALIFYLKGTDSAAHAVSNFTLRARKTPCHGGPTVIETIPVEHSLSFALTGASREGFCGITLEPTDKPAGSARPTLTITLLASQAG